MSTFHGLIQEIPGISVDRFEGKNLDSSVFFLSHCHTDHMEGLNLDFWAHLKRNNRYLYCFSITKTILENTFCQVLDQVRKIDHFGSSWIGYRTNGEEEHVEVTCIPSGHCLGSVMFLFEKPDLRILYTGDFRIHPKDLHSFAALHCKIGDKKIPKRIDKVYLDTTFCKESYRNFPSRKESLLEILKISNQWLERNPRNLVLLDCSANYGSEFLFKELSMSLKQRIHVRAKTYKACVCIPELKHLVTDDPRKTRIHACTDKGRNLNCQEVCQTNVLRIIPSAYRWEGTNFELANISEWNERVGNVVNVCYSMHSSYEEIKGFLEYFRPSEIYPCAIPKGTQEEELFRLLENIKKSYRDNLISEDKKLNVGIVDEGIINDRASINPDVYKFSADVPFSSFKMELFSDSSDSS